MAPDISQNKKYMAVGALALGLGSFGLKKYRDIKISSQQKEEIDKLKNEELKIFEERVKKMNEDEDYKNKMIRNFLLASVGAILLRGTIKSNKKGGSNIKKKKFFSKKRKNFSLKKNKNNNKSVKNSRIKT